MQNNMTATVIHSRAKCINGINHAVGAILTIITIIIGTTSIKSGGAMREKG
jgi:predicted membrane channel-forming protein YqfA (hemolysin III family)